MITEVKNKKCSQNHNDIWFPVKMRIQYFPRTSIIHEFCQKKSIIHGL